MMKLDQVCLIVQLITNLQVILSSEKINIPNSNSDLIGFINLNHMLVSAARIIVASVFIKTIQAVNKTEIKATKVQFGKL